ncbi:DUF805 domain-containing protein [Xanthobacter sp. V3C-3]|uniref:DUF805 domain-containing protein n=1 Tax=Xanthobacter lutulentifluminis TaxID=3119935 RepID=UPI00372C11A2
MDLPAAFITCRSKYAVFSGRASRSEFWWFQLAVALMTIGASYFSERAGPPLSDFGPLAFNLVVLCPVLAVGSRRLHDIGRTGWWQLLLFTGAGVVVLIFWWILPSQPGSNRYGEEPEADKGTPPASPIPPVAHPQPAPQSAPEAHSAPASAPPIESREAPRGMLDWTKTPPVSGVETQAKPKDQSGSKGMPLILIFLIAFAAFVVAYYAQNNGGALKDIFSRLQSTVSSVTTGAIAGGGSSGFQLSSEKDKMTNERVYVGYQRIRNGEGLQLEAVFKCTSKDEIIGDLISMATYCGKDGNAFMCPDNFIRNMKLNVSLFDKNDEPVHFLRNDRTVSYERKMTPNGDIERKFTGLERAGDTFYNNSIEIVVPADFDKSNRPDFAGEAADDGTDGIIYRFNALGKTDPIDLHISYKDRQFMEMTKACNRNMPTLAEIRARAAAQQGQR